MPFWRDAARTMYMSGFVKRAPNPHVCCVTNYYITCILYYIKRRDTTQHAAVLEQHDEQRIRTYGYRHSNNPPLHCPSRRHFAGGHLLYQRAVVTKLRIW